MNIHEGYSGQTMTHISYCYLTSVNVNKMFRHRRYTHVVFLFDFFYVFSSKAGNQAMVLSNIYPNYSPVGNAVAQW